MRLHDLVWLRLPFPDFRRVSCLFVGLSLFTATVEAAPIADVRAVYLVPSDRTYNLQYELGIINAFTDLQDWYAGELGGPTYVLNDPIVEVFNTPHVASYYETNPSGPSRCGSGATQLMTRSPSRAPASMIRTMPGSSTSTRNQRSVRSAVPGPAEWRCFPSMTSAG